jgi:hypothetical protein
MLLAPLGVWMMGVATADLEANRSFPQAASFALNARKPTVRLNDKVVANVLAKGYEEGDRCFVKSEHDRKRRAVSD